MLTLQIKHLGIVENINGSHLKVKIVQTSACASCSAKAHCHVSESKEKTIDVYNRENIPCKIGEQVWIVGTTSMGMKAVLLAFIIPFLIILAALITALHLTENEVAAALIALLSYYIYVPKKAKPFIRIYFRNCIIILIN
jgi:sigma-E factor negative regulatory protein RseC